MRKLFFDPRRILEIPFIYKLLQKIAGANANRKQVISKSIPASEGLRILEIGCGLGNNIEYLPNGVEYVGCDISQKYIEQARRKYKGRGIFLNASVDDVFKKDLGEFDYVLAITVLHHLDDIQVKSLAKGVKQLLSKDGYFITTDACRAANPSWLENCVISMDRGKFIRYPSQYEKLLKDSFPNVETIISKVFFLYLLPMNVCSMRAWKMKEK
jgi:2-polyprenyl-3-methyl-5-hydroxy-6-metoxy-1,4-benzoquinol methylase